MPKALHDMGGNERFFGPIVREAEEPVFHERWEALTFGLTLAASGILGGNLDAARDAIERLDPEVYLRGYYVRWLGSLERQLEARGFVAEGELEARVRGQRSAARGTRRVPAWQRAIRTWFTRKIMAPMPRWLLRTYPRMQGFSRKAPSGPAFRPGDRVRTVPARPSGHTRIPGYVCGRRGTVTRAHGAMVFPDVHARGRKQDPKHLYTVAFEGTELWGLGSEPGVVLLVDLFEPYLETT